MMSKQHKRAIPINIKRGDVVMIQQPERIILLSKLAPKCRDPYNVVRYIHANKFKFMELSINVTLVVHSVSLKTIPSTSDFSTPSCIAPVERLRKTFVILIV